MRYPSNPTAGIRKQFAKGTSGSGMRLGGTAYRQAFSVPDDIRPFFNPHRSTYQDLTEVELRKQFVQADSALHHASDRMIRVKFEAAYTEYLSVFNQIKQIVDGQ
jgi:hypothetical protein